MTPPGFLPPEPSGSEPDLGAPAPPPPPPPPPPQQYAPPQQQLGWGRQPPQPQPQPQWAWQPSQPPVPDNGVAVTGFVLSLVAAGLLLISFGLSSIVSIVCAGLGTFYSRKGKQRVERGETPKHAGLAQAGFITGIVTLVLALLATVAWVLIIVLYATNEDFRRDFEDDFESAALAIQYLAALLP